MKYMALAFGGALGTILRYTVSGLSYKLLGASFPSGTLMVNATGSLIIGLLWAWSESTSITSDIRTLLFIGILGSYTTFSTYMLESMNLIRGGEMKMAFLNILANNVIALAFVFTGFYGLRLLIQHWRIL